MKGNWLISGFTFFHTHVLAEWYIQNITIVIPHYRMSELLLGTI